MLKIKCKQLRLSSKGNLKRIICNGIPVLSIFALVGICLYTVNRIGVFYNSSAYAIWCDPDAIQDPTTGTCIDPNNPVCPSGYTWDSINQKCIEAPETTASLTIAGSTSNETISAGRGETVYRTHTISIAGSNVKNYVLSIYGDSKLSYVENSSTGQLSTTEYLSSANNTKGSNLPTNTWGYAYSNSTSTSNADLTYTAPTTSAITLASGTIPTGSNGVLSITNNKLVFAAKFDEDKPSGNYKANVNLALTITPRVLTTYSITYDCSNGTGCPTNYTENSYEESKTYTIPTTTPTRSGYKFLGYSTSSSATTADANYAPGKAISLTQAAPSVELYAVWKYSLSLSGIANMQQMTADICGESEVGETNTLTDLRGGSYNVQKLADGKCWMTSSLRLTNYMLTSANSNVTSFALPASSSAGFTTSNYYQADVYDNGSATFYSWTAATAGVGTSGVTSGDVSSSICPKGWFLPSYNDFQQLINIGYGLSGGNMVVGGVVWPFSGTYYNNKMRGEGSDGYYYSRTAVNGNSAYVFHVYESGSASIASNYQRYAGFSVRCVAYSS